MEQEESYTLNTDLTADDAIPVYGKEEKTKPCFSGQRISRGLYRTHDEKVLNADLNATGNILRKAFPDIFKVAGFAFLQDILIRNYTRLNKRTPAEGIGAA